MDYGYIEVEGQQDAELLARVLKVSHGFSRVRALADLDAYWKRLVPTAFPATPDGDLLRRVRVPVFVASGSHSLALSVAGSDSRLVASAEESLSQLDDYGQRLVGLAFVLDQDSTASVADRLGALRNRLRERGRSWPFGVPELAGQVVEATGSPGASATKVGAFVLPDNQAMGTLEDLLLDCAVSSYPTLAEKAAAYVGAIDVVVDLPERADSCEFGKPAGRRKAIVAAIGAVLRPGRTTAVSIQDNRWLTPDTICLPRANGLLAFLESLLGLDRPPER